MAKSTSSTDLDGTLGMAGGAIKQGRLVWRLLRDGRVPSWTKMIPLVGLVYLLSPIDLIPDLMLPGLGQLDDLAVILLSLKLFIELCPPGVVKEYLGDLTGQKSGTTASGSSASGPYIEVPYEVMEPDNATTKENPYD
jgi:uncharacterized membrane protein YkvA (DUF1232 family)